MMKILDILEYGNSGKSVNEFFSLEIFVSTVLARVLQMNIISLFLRTRTKLIIIFLLKTKPAIRLLKKNNSIVARGNPLSRATTQLLHSTTQ
jgi:hypothetical protein